MTETNRKTKTVAIIGSGISGLMTAYLLHNFGKNILLDNNYVDYDVQLFEANSRLGGHTATMNVTHQGEDYAIDTGFIVYNDWTYPNFIRLLGELNIKSQKSEMSFSVSCDDTGLEYSGNNLNTLFAQRRNLLNPAFLKMLRLIIRFNKQAIEDLDNNKISKDITLGAYLNSNNYAGLFSSHYLVPMCAAIWSASTESVLNFPLLFFVNFFKNHGLLSISDRPQWRVIQGGSSSYIKPLVENFKDRVTLDCKITSVERKENGAFLCFESGEKMHFDEVVFACHSDQALGLLADASFDEKKLLGAMPYKNNKVVLHTDASLLPKKKRAWAAWNYLLSGETQDSAVLTYDMNILQGIHSKSTFCVTLNAKDRIDPATILGEYDYAHPSISLASVSAQKNWANINGVKNTWFCGAYWGNGFHEDGVVSALRVAEGLGVKWL
ncbi:NAD(P)/FAD-dependent oxidoreductase [Aurantivibrio infirmus]